MNVTFHPESTDQSRPESYYQRAVAKSRSGDHAAAVDLFSMAIKSDPRNTAHYIGRAEALLKNECFQRALEDAREAVKLDPSGPLTYKAHEISGTALFKLGQFRDAKVEFQKSIGSLDCPPAQKCLSQWLYFCDEKIARLEKLSLEVNNIENEEKTIKDSVPVTTSLVENDEKCINQNIQSETTLVPEDLGVAPEVPKKSIGYTWYQTDLDVVVEVLVRQLVTDQVTVTTSEKEVDIVIKDLKDDSIIFCLTLKLSQSIVVEKSSHKILPSKLEIRLRKRDTKYWPALELSTDTSKPAIKSTKSWDLAELTLDGDDEDVGDEIHKLFQQVYLAGDDDTRRAMNKSFQESAGTVLSTDWSSTKRRKVEVAAPDGMELKQWN